MFKGDNKSVFVSIFLHCFVVFCIALYIFVSDFFVDEDKEDKFVFEMLQADMPETPKVPEQKVPEQNLSTPESFIEEIDIKEAKVLDIPAPIVVEKPKPSPKPEPKPKVEAKAQYETVNIAEYNKSRNLKPQKTTQAKKPLPNVTSIKSGFSTASDVKVANLSGADLNNAVEKYLYSLKLLAKSKYILPEGAKAMKLSVDINFNVSASGKLTGVRVVKSSGNSIFDNSVISLFNGLQSFVPPNNKAIENVRLTFESI